MFICGYCGKKFETLSERCKCEQECGKKQEVEIRRKKQEELDRIKKDRDDEITNATICLIKQINSYHTDYGEKCNVESPARYGLHSDYLKIMAIIRNLCEM